MKRRIVASILVLVAAAVAVGLAAATSGVKLPKCSQVKCRDIGCPADVLCVAGQVKTCADVCNGH